MIAVDDSTKTFAMVPLALSGRPNLAGRWSTYNVSVLKLSNVSFRGKCARMGNTLKIPSPTKLARLGHFPPARQAGGLAGPVFCMYVFVSGIAPEREQ
jgi:hypothetical protein